jgi:hypothetical protein
MWYYTAVEFVKFTERPPNFTDLNPLCYHFWKKLGSAQSLVLLQDGTEDVWPLVSHEYPIFHRFRPQCKETGILTDVDSVIIVI